MTRLPLALGLALVIAAAAVVYVTVTPKPVDVVVINLTNVQIPSNITLPGLPKAIYFYNITKKDFCLYIDIPGGMLIGGEGWVVLETINVGCFLSYVNYGYTSFTVYFNMTTAPNWYDWGLRVVKPPKYVVIRIEPLTRG